MPKGESKQYNGFALENMSTPSYVYLYRDIQKPVIFTQIPLGLSAAEITEPAVQKSREGGQGEVENLFLVAEWFGRWLCYCFVQFFLQPTYSKM